MISGRMLILASLAWLIAGGRMALSDENTNPPTHDAKHESAPSVVWADEATGRVLFSTKDIIRFDWKRQAFQLTHNAAMDFEAWFPPHMQLDRKFIVRDSDGIIYRGARISSVSSFSYDVPAICDLVFDKDDVHFHRPEPPLYEILDGSPANRKVDTIRRNERLRTQLAKTGVLGELDPTHPPEPIEVVSVPWTGDKQLRVRMEVFAETVCVGRPVRVHLFLSNYPRSDLGFDTLAVKMAFLSNDGRFVSHTLVDGVALKKCLDDGIWVCLFKPWSPDPDSRDAIAKVGPAELTAELLLQKQGQPSPNSGNIGRSVRLPKAMLKVLPAPDSN